MKFFFCVFLLFLFFLLNIFLLSIFKDIHTNECRKKVYKNKLIFKNLFFYKINSILKKIQQHGKKISCNFSSKIFLHFFLLLSRRNEKKIQIIIMLKGKFVRSSVDYKLFRFELILTRY